VPQAAPSRPVLPSPAGGFASRPASPLGGSPSAPPRPAAPTGGLGGGSGGSPSPQPYRPSWARDDDNL
jgi:hypothetical protein